VLSIAFTAIVMLTKGIETGAGNMLLAVIVLALVYIVNAGYGGGFPNVPTLLSDHYGMGSISAIHGITLSAWAFAGLTGNQVASLIVKNTGSYQFMYNKVLYAEEAAAKAAALAGGVSEADLSNAISKVNPVGYQNVLIFTIILYVIALFCCLFLVKPTDKALEAKKAKKA
ncbi:MAG: hypothetical protein IKO11_07600, partial [Lachnospiraceae bacterium]|nr:hypothetical protein [Lachnospiraceae bacterium]